MNCFMKGKEKHTKHDMRLSKASMAASYTSIKVKLNYVVTVIKDEGNQNVLVCYQLLIYKIRSTYISLTIMIHVSCS